MTLPGRYKLVTAIHLNSRGFAFVLFQGPFAPQDWSAVEARGEYKREKILTRVDALLARHRPDFVVLQDISHAGTHRPHRIRRLNEAIATVAEKYGCPIIFLSRDQVRQQFAYLGRVTKDTIAAAIAKNVPAFERFLPPPRKPWKSEDARMGLFDAAALALTFFQDGQTPNQIPT